MQFEDNTFHFTQLIMYQSHQDNAPVALRLINYTDLKNDKDLVLLRGEYDTKSLVCSKSSLNVRDNVS